MSENDTRGAESRSFASFSSRRAWDSGGSVPAAAKEGTRPALIPAPLLEAGVELGRQRPGVDEGGHLADLHRSPLHRAQHVEDLLRRVHLATLGRLPATLLGAGEVRRLGRIRARRLAAHEAAELRGPP